MDVARQGEAELIVVDTSSLISGVYGQILKYHKMEVTRPEYVIGFERGEELDPLLGIARRFTPAQVEAYPVHPEARPTTADERAETRRARFAAYFSGNLHRWRVKPTVFLPLPPEADVAALAGLLVGMEDGKGSCVGIGYLELAEDGSLRMISTVSEGARALRLGSTRITPTGPRPHGSTSATCSAPSSRRWTPSPGGPWRKSVWHRLRLAALGIGWVEADDGAVAWRGGPSSPVFLGALSLRAGVPAARAAAAVGGWPVSWPSGTPAGARTWGARVRPPGP